ncbi:unnamed protein product, partial [Rotaria magnacalcarata]
MSNTSNNNNNNNNNEMCPDNSTKRYRKSPNSNPISNQWNPTFTDELTANF